MDVIIKGLLHTVRKNNYHSLGFLTDRMARKVEKEIMKQRWQFMEIASKHFGRSEH